MIEFLTKTITMPMWELCLINFGFAFVFTGIKYLLHKDDDEFYIGQIFTDPQTGEQFKITKKVDVIDITAESEVK